MRWYSGSMELLIPGLMSIFNLRHICNGSLKTNLRLVVQSNNGIIRRITPLWIKSIMRLHMNFKKSDDNSVELVRQVPHKAVKSKRNSSNLEGTTSRCPRRNLTLPIKSQALILYRKVMFFFRKAPYLERYPTIKVKCKIVQQECLKTKLADVQFCIWGCHSIRRYRFTIEMWGPGQKFRPGRVPAQEVKKTAIFSREHTSLEMVSKDFANL